MADKKNDKGTSKEGMLLEEESLREAITRHAGRGILEEVPVAAAATDAPSAGDESGKASNVIKERKVSKKEKNELPLYFQEVELGEGHKRAKQAGRPKSKKMSEEDYLKEIEPLHLELVKCQNWIRANGHRLLCIFEGRDAGGKGGTIKRFMEHINPRFAKVVALDKPNDRERTQWYFQRYVTHLPAGGEIALYDRSWYNRAGVERVMGFCTEEQVKEFLRVTPVFENILAKSGIIIFKFWFSIQKEEQLRRFNSRREDPLKQWKLSPVDRESQDNWDKYTVAKEDMFYYTDSAWAPWTIVKGDNKKQARLNAIRYFLSRMPYDDKDEKILNWDPAYVRTVKEELGFEGPWTEFK